MVELFRLGHRGDLLDVRFLVLVDLLILRYGSGRSLGRATGTAGDLLLDALDGLK